MKNIGKIFWILLISAVILRIVLLFWVIPLPFASNGDLTRYEDWAQVAHIYSLSDTYSGHHTKTVVNNEPPGTLYLISSTYETYILIGKVIAKLTHTQAGSILWVNTFLLHIWMRIPSIIAELCLGIIAYFLVAKHSDDKKALLAASIIWFNPAIFYNGTLWGQMDSLNNLFFLLALALAFNKKYIFSIISYGISIYIKFSLLPLLPFYLVFLYFSSKHNLNKLTIGLVLTCIGIILATFPISSNPLLWLITNTPHLAGGELQNITNAAFNFWWFITCGPTCNYPPVINVPFLWISLNLWGYILFFAATLPILYLQLKQWKQMISKEFLFLGFSLIAFSIFLFLPKMHDRYLYPVFPLFAIFIGFTKYKKIYILLYIILSLLHLINFMYSWIPTYFPFFWMYKVIYSRIFDWIVSICIVIIAAIFFFKAYRYLLSHSKLSDRI